MTRTQLLVAKNKRRQQIRRDVEAWLFVIALMIVGFIPAAVINAMADKYWEVVTIDICNEDGVIYSETFEDCYVKVHKEEK